MKYPPGSQNTQSLMPMEACELWVFQLLPGNRGNHGYGVHSGASMITWICTCRKKTKMNSDSGLCLSSTCCANLFGGLKYLNGRRLVLIWLPWLMRPQTTRCRGFVVQIMRTQLAS